MTQQTIEVVRAHRYMMVFPIAAAVSALVIVLILVVAGLGLLGLTATGDSGGNDDALGASTIVIGVILLVLAAYAGTLSVQLCMGGLVSAADEVLQGRSSSFRAGMSVAFRRFGAIAGWAAIQAAVGWLLSAIQGNGDDNIVVSIVRTLLSTLAAVAWRIISFFALPLIVLRQQGSVSAIRNSVSLIRNTWGMQVAGGVRIGLPVAIFGIFPGVALIVGGVVLTVTDHGLLGLPLLVIGIIVVIIATAIMSALRSVFSVALLHYAEGHEALGPYSSEQLRSAVKIIS